jgi:hypothetical protein
MAILTAATIAVQTETVSSLVGSGLFAPPNDRARRCTERTGLLRGAGMVMPQRTRELPINVSTLSELLRKKSWA